jgi:isopentenyl-diphosphate delta-isomerase
MNDEIVSFDSEELILVDENDIEVGHLHKDKCHDDGGLLHRAFSLFIFNEQGEVLIQRRSAQKRLWPLYWANTCCSHPRHGEEMDEAVRRRLYQELGMRTDPVFLYKFIYHAHYEDQGAEHEFCWVYIGKSSDPVRANPNEISEWKYVAPSQLGEELDNHPDNFSPWIKLEWETMQKNFQQQLQSL